MTSYFFDELVTDQKKKNYLKVPELPGQVEDLHEGERHRDEAEHQVRDGQVDDEDVPGCPHGGVPGHHVDHHLE